MADIGRDPQAVRAYERTRAGFAERRVVDEAEEVLGRIWTAELEDVRRAALGVIAVTRLSAKAAISDVRAAQNEGRHFDLSRARARLAALEAEHAADFIEARAVLAWVDSELVNAGRVGIERRRRIKRDLEDLRAAWAAAYGVGRDRQDRP